MAAEEALGRTRDLYSYSVSEEPRSFRYPGYTTVAISQGSELSRRNLLRPGGTISSTGLESEASACCCLPTDGLGHRAMLVQAELSPAGSSFRIRIAQRPRLHSRHGSGGLSARVTSYDRHPTRRLPSRRAGVLFYSGVRSWRVASSQTTAWRRASRRALQMRPARLCRARAMPTWFGRAPLHAAVISCCVLPVARATT